MTLRLPQEAGVDTPAQVVHRDMLNHNVLRLHLRPSDAFSCEPGQYITLINSLGAARSYSVANDASNDGHIELHVRVLANGVMSQFLLQDADIGTRMEIRGPAGSCFYVADCDNEFPLILAGTGTGLAPLLGIARQALAKRHRGSVQLFHGALQTEDLYLVEELKALERSCPHFRYSPCVLNGETGRFYLPGNIEDIVMRSMPQEKTSLRLYLCGAPDFVKSLRRKAFIAGVRSSHIFADAFLSTKPAGTAA
jgi:NAD(P)H-flavin reductase